jgi:HEAT repeat protein
MYVAKLIDMWEGDGGGPAQYGSAGFDVVQALALLGPEARPARDKLFKAIEDEKTALGTRNYAVQALSQLGDDAAVIVPRMIAHVEGARKGGVHSEVRRSSVEVLGALGPKAKEAVPLLRRLAESDDDSLADAAAAALERIEAKK